MRKVPIPLGRRFDDFRRRALPLAVWLAAVFGVVQLVQLRGSQVEFLGLAEVSELVVTAPADGTIAELAVELYDPVASGQVLAVFDPEPLSARIRTSAAEVERLAAERAAVAAELASQAEVISNDWEKDARRFQVDAADLRVELLQARVELEADRVELERRRVAYQRAQSLVESAVLSEAEAEDLLLASEVVAARIEATVELVARLELEHDAAQTRARAFLAAAPEELVVEPRLAALQRAVEVEELRIAEIELARAALVVRSPSTGRVGALLASAGRTVVLGQGLLSVTPSVGEAVTFYLPPAASHQVAVGDRVQVHRPGERQTAEGVVAVLAPAVAEIPAALWRDPAVPEYGRAVRLKPQPGLSLVPGEPVQVALVERG